jgi:hypothetical protein
MERKKPSPIVLRDQTGVQKRAFKELSELLLGTIGYENVSEASAKIIVGWAPDEQDYSYMVTIKVDLGTREAFAFGPTVENAILGAVEAWEEQDELEPNLFRPPQTQEEFYAVRFQEIAEEAEAAAEEYRSGGDGSPIPSVESIEDRLRQICSTAARSGRREVARQQAHGMRRRFTKAR